MARKNLGTARAPSFLGAGAYRHHIPASVDHLIQRGEFLTSYTPYQPEVSQGRLEALLNFQQMVIDLTGLEIANASLLDEGTAAAEAMAMAHRLVKVERNCFFVDADTHPQTIAVIRAMLPLRAKVIHCRWSGESVWIPYGDLRPDVGWEHHTSHPAPGHLALYPGGQSETELLFPYGYCNFASKAGQLWANHFATLVEGQEQLKELGRLTLWEGAQPISFREA